MVTAAQIRETMNVIDAMVKENRVSEGERDQVFEVLREELQIAIERETPPTAEQLVQRIAAAEQYMREEGHKLWCGEQDAVGDTIRAMNAELHEAWEREQQGMSICPCQSCRVDRWIAEEERENN
jgi:hypothetical protein